ncbi:MAG: serine hydrolase [Gemmatimonadota bacterium]|nr:serine hydrolase [Gemmatimonadota bacterium]
MKILKSFLIVTFLTVFSSGCQDIDEGPKPEKGEKSPVAEAGTIFPDSQWLRAKPEDQGFDQAVIDSIGEIMKKNKANGVLIRNGYLVGEWSFGGEADKKFDTQSVSKSIASMTLGLAIRDNLISSIDDLVVDYYPDFKCGPYSDSITFRHLVTNTSGIALTRWKHQRNPGWMKPGIENHYHNDHWTELARALTYIFGKPLKQVLEENVLNVIDAEMDWWKDHTIGGYVRKENGDSILVNAGYAFSCWSARDLARVGYLYLNKGNWKGKQVIPEEYVRESWTEITQPIGGHRPGPGKAKRVSFAGYGLGWWTGKGSGIWSMSGNGGQFCVVIPKYNIVMTKVNDYNIERKQQLSNIAFIPLVLKAMGEDVSEMMKMYRQMMRKRENTQTQDREIR